MSDLEELIGADTPVSAGRLETLEVGVWRRVARHNERSRNLRLRLSVVGMALGLGGVTGGVVSLAPRPEPSELRIFTVEAGVTPLAVLSARG